MGQGIVATSLFGFLLGLVITCSIMGGIAVIAYLIYADGQNLEVRWPSLSFSRERRRLRKRECQLQSLKYDIAEDELLEQRRRQQENHTKALGE